MSAIDKLKQVMKDQLRRRGYGVYRLSDAERTAYLEHVQRSAPQPAQTGDLGRLEELRRRYAEVDLPVTQHSIWAPRGGSGGRAEIGWGGVDLPNFRAHSAYVWDYAGAGFELTRMRYFLFAQHARERDRLGLLKTLAEDGAFGCIVFEFEGFGLVSRDLLDSVIELNFLQEHLGLLTQDGPGVLDIGAGYGRIAHRMLTASPSIGRYTCLDAIPESTFLCEYYLGYRGLLDRAEVIPLDEIEARLEPGAYTVALNVHSFSECTYAAIEWWLRKVRELEVPNLLIVPNEGDGFSSLEPDHSRRDYAPLLAELGFELAAEQPVFGDPQVRKLIGVNDNMYLFKARR